MTADELKMAYEVFKQVAQDNKSDHDKYNQNVYAQNYSDNEYYLKFMSWIKQTYPEVWESWRALKDLELSAEINVPKVSGFR